LNKNPKLNWSRDELIVAFNLYCKTPFTKINSSNETIQELSKVVGRSASSVALKLANFARLDPDLQKRNISGMRHGSKGEIEIWSEFSKNWEELAYQSELILAKYRNNSVENSIQMFLGDLPKDGIERETIIKTRVNQAFFRKTILASYNNRCCITGLPIPELLIASHIIPWAIDRKNRMNPCNGLCLNAFHDKAFDTGFISISADYTIILSRQLRKLKDQNILNNFFLCFEGKQIILPQKFFPDKTFLEYHNKNIFIDSRN